MSEVRESRDKMPEDDDRKKSDQMTEDAGKSSRVTPPLEALGVMHHYHVLQKTKTRLDTLNIDYLTLTDTLNGDYLKTT